LIQNRADGKLVELPSAASLAGSRTGQGGDDDDDGPGPSSYDEKKISKIEDITLEYSYLLSSQLEQQRKYFEGEIAKSQKELAGLRQQITEDGVARTAAAEEERKLRELEVRVIPGLEQAKVKAEKRAETVSVGSCVEYSHRH
jgi:BRCA1-associated protein